MRIHLIAVGGAVMHNLAIDLKNKGNDISGSDDQIFEPSLSRLKENGLLPEKMGWDASNITNELDFIVIGMHAKADNPEILKALELGIKMYSFPEYAYKSSENSIRVVVAGSHGKTSITSMIMHALKAKNIETDYLVGSQLPGFKTMVNLSGEAPIAVFEGDEYLSSPIDLRPKFMHYKPKIALVSGIAWDHINVFPTKELYNKAFIDWFESLAEDTYITYADEDKLMEDLILKHAKCHKIVKYSSFKYELNNGNVSVLFNDKKYPTQISGSHNFLNLAGAANVCEQLGISKEDFLDSMVNFSGAAKRLEKMHETENCTIFRDFAHSPSKVKATIKGIKEQYPERKLIACLELHTFSSLTKAFLPEYEGSMYFADDAIVYFNPQTIEHKKLEPISIENVVEAFNKEGIKVFTDSTELYKTLENKEYDNSNLLIMSSGNFDNLNWKELVNFVANNNGIKSN